MKEILTTIIQSLVSKPDSITINEIENEKSIIFEVKVNEEDMGKVIGKQGKIAKSIRTIIRAIAAKEQKRVSIEFLD